MRRASAEPSVEVKQKVKSLYLQYAKLEEDYGLAKRAMQVYDQAVKVVPNSEKLNMYEIYIALGAEIFGVTKTREIFEQTIGSGLPDKDVKTLCLKYVEMEKKLGEIERACGIYVFASKFADSDFWNKWHEFEVQHGNQDTFREMLRIKRSVSASYNQNGQLMNLDETKDRLQEAGIRADEMTAFERQLPPEADKAKTKKRKVGFVKSQFESDGGIKIHGNHEEIELIEENDYDDKIEIVNEDVACFFGGFIRKKRRV